MPDTLLQRYISQKHSLHEEISNDISLQSLKGEKLTFTDVLAQHRNKVIYVDFWASWCAPCIRALPASRQLQKEYAGKDVVCLYLSIDEDLEKWTKAAQKHQLNNSQKSFVVANRNSSRLLDDLNVSSIPRYMILDRKGNLVHQNAPGPGSNEVRDLFNKYLKESSKRASL